MEADTSLPIISEPDMITPEIEIIEPIIEQPEEERKEGTVVSEDPLISMTRKQLYDEIWEIAVAGVARKYDIPYNQLIKQIKDADIPIPPSGYWVKLEYGKPVTKPELTGSNEDIVNIYKTAPKVQTKKAASNPLLTKLSGSDNKKLKKSSDTKAITKSELKADPKSQSTVQPPVAESDVLKTDEIDIKVETYTQYDRTYNVYDRETLYRAVWQYPVVDVAKQYGVSDVTIHKICKCLDIPTPPPGFWTKLRSGKPATKMPLPKNCKFDRWTGLRTGIEQKPQVVKETLEFMSEEDRAIVLAVASQLIIPDENAKMHPKIIEHRKKLIEWKKPFTERADNGYNTRRTDSMPLLADTVSEESLPRIYRIIDALIKATEPLGCSLTDDLKFIVNGETVSITITEAKDEVNHVLTKEENMMLLKYEDDRRRYSWASKPNIRKYDRPYNGRITINVYSIKGFRDSKSSIVEERLGDILIQLYEASDVIRKQREAREEAERKRQEEERLKQERRNRYNAEIDRTLELTNLADDYDTACKIRRYISAVEVSSNMDEKTLHWLKWAKAKADWYDPTIASKDDILGKREHEKDREYKKLVHAGYRW